MIRQHLFNGAQPGSPEHLEKYLSEQKLRREKESNTEFLWLTAASFLAGSLATLAFVVPL
ncbi:MULTISPECIES: hypothetical protein [unclassified Halomonas]|uniref:hypothetical protein n=1 Tax=unclassified Halomonas TaxID=2609666 RepID=UPI0020767B5C|nr:MULTISPECIES: hypothetical protein [unclassified Halomonas]